LRSLHQAHWDHWYRGYGHMALVVAPRFSKRFRRLCQAAAIAGTGRSAQVVDGLVILAMVYGDGPWRDPEDWSGAIEALFGLAVSEADVLAARERGVEAKRLVYNSFSGQYALSATTRQAAVDRVEAGEELEHRAQASWLAEAEPLVPELDSNALWSCLLGYARNAFLSHGLEAIKLFDSSVRDFADLASDETPEALLKLAMAESNLPLELLPQISKAIAIFFDGQDSDRVEYVAELVNSTYNFLALSLDPETRVSLLENLPSLTIFIDTNIIYSALGAHDSPMNAAATDLFRVLQENDFPFRVYYHEKTLQEVEWTLETIGDRLRSQRCSPAVSRALRNFSRGMSSIEVRYHQINSKFPTSVDVFLSKYSNLPILLAEYGLTIFRQSADSTEEDRKRAELVAEYQAFLAEKNRNEKAYHALNHDITVWLAAVKRQRPRQKGPLSAGALIISADHIFRSFDREILSPLHGTGTWLVTLPDTLLQALQPFLTSPQHSDAAFAKIFATPELRGIGQDHGEIVGRVASVLATYEDMTEETATKILSNALLLSRLKHLDQRSDEFQRIIQEELVRENEALQQERDNALERMRQARAEAAQMRALMQREISNIADHLQAGSNPELAARISELEKRLADQPNAGSKISVAEVYMGDRKEYSGGYYHNTDTQIGAQGPGARAENFTQQASDQEISIDLPALAVELDTLRKKLLQKAASAADYQAVAEIQAAKEAADEGDDRTIWQHLAAAGRWTFDIAVDIGTEIAAKALSHAIGMGP
jgi:hypothetical protein